MRTEKCRLCVNYKPQPVDQMGGREWMNATGWCELPNLTVKRRRVNEDSWCDMYAEREFIPEPSQTIGEALEILDSEQKPDESFGSETNKSFEHWKLSIREAIAEVKHKLNELDVLVNTPYEDLE